MKQRDLTIDILKSLGIILMVIGHSKCPEWLDHYIYSFHMPLFFIIGGLFLKKEVLLSPIKFYIRKLKGLYIPFVLISLVFLLLHNTFLDLGIRNEIHPSSSEYYTWTNIGNLSKSIIFFMDGHDNDGFLGAFWFIRSLFVGSVLFCVIVNLLNRFFRSFNQTVFVSVFLFFIVGGIVRYFDYSIPFMPRGGYRELIAAFFIGSGFIIRNVGVEVLMKNARIIAICFALSILINLYHHPSLAPDSDLLCWWLLPITAFCGYACFYYISSGLKDTILKELLVFIGQNTWWIISLHFLCFKLSMLIEIWLFNKNISVLSSWPVDASSNPFFFLVHVFVGVVIPVLFAFLWQKGLNKLVYKRL